MSDENLSKGTDAEAIVEEYLGIVERFGIASAEAQGFREAHADCRDLADIDAAYSAMGDERARGRLRGCLVVLILLVVIAIGVLGSRYGIGVSQKTLEMVQQKRSFEEQLEEQKSDLSDRIQQIDAVQTIVGVFNTFLRSPGAVETAGTSDSTAARFGASVRLNEPAADEQVIHLDASDPGTSFYVGGERVESVRVPAGEQEARFEVRMADLSEARTVVVGSSAGQVDRQALTVVPQAVRAAAPATVALELLYPAPAGGTTVHLESTDPDVQFRVAGEAADRINVPQGERRFQFEVISSPGQPDRIAPLLITVEGNAPVVIRVPAPAIGELTGVPREVIAGGDPVPVTLQLERLPESTDAVPIRMTSSNPAVSFHVGGEAVAEFTPPQTGELKFEIVTRPVDTPQLADVIVERGGTRREISFVLAPPPVPPPPVPPPSASVLASVAVMPRFVTGGNTLSIDIPLARPLSPEELAEVEVEAEGIRFTPGEHEDKTLRFEGVVQPVDQPRLTRVVARFGEHSVESIVAVSPPPPVPDPGESVPRPAFGEFTLPARLASGQGPVPVTIPLARPATEETALPVMLASSHPAVSFLVDGQPVSSITPAPGDDRLTFTLAAKEVAEPQAALISVRLGSDSHHAALLIGTRPVGQSPIDSLQLPPQGVRSGDAITATIRLRKPLPAEALTVRAENLDFTPDSPNDAEPGLRTFQAVAPEVAAPTLLPITVRSAVGDTVNVETGAVLILPVARPALGEMSVRRSDEDPTVHFGELTLTRAGGNYRVAVFLESSEATVHVPELVVVPPDKSTVTFPVDLSEASGVRTVVITARLGEEAKQTTLELEPQEPRPPAVVPPAVVPPAVVPPAVEPPAVEPPEDGPSAVESPADTAAEDAAPAAGRKCKLRRGRARRS